MSTVFKNPLSHGKRYILLSLVLSCFCSCKNEPPPDKKSTTETDTKNRTVFQRVPSAKSKLLFENSLRHNVATRENLFDFDYFYNGAGVGIADLNKDGLQDIFFCGNQVKNKLYFNQGNLVFEDSSEKANINNGKTWSNGVTFVDINNDTWLDIYVSQGGPNERSQRKNLFFINQKDGTFQESAESLGLADMGISTQSVFFDFDNDGDLDCLVMNENEYYGVDPIRFYPLVGQNDETRHFNSSHLYRNEGGKFIDITKEAGIERPIFGLGLTVSDINGDGWLDFYIASDYYIPDALFINNQDGTFSDRIKEYTNHISYYGMGMDIADINNDELQDIFVLDMAANDHVRSKTLMASMNTNRFDYLVNKAEFHYQYMYNSLQLNQSGNKFTNIAQATSMANTDWSWSVLLSDYDHDSDKDVFITNGYRRYALDNDLQRKVYEAKVAYRGKVPLEVKKQLYDAMPSEKLPNIVYQNNGNLKFNDSSSAWGLADFSFSNGAAQGDLDNDGDLDLVINNMDENCFLYKNLTMENQRGNYIKIDAYGKLSESFPKITIKYNGKRQFLETRRVRGYRSAHENIAHFGLGSYSSIDTVTVEWPSGTYQEKYNVKVNTTVQFLEAEGRLANREKDMIDPPFFNRLDNKEIGLDFRHRENSHDDFEKEILLPYKQSTLGPFISEGDVNGDDMEDIFIGGASGQSAVLFVQQKNGRFLQKSVPIFQDDRNYEDMESVFFDFDNDNDLDLFVVSGGNEFAHYSSLYADRLYLNDGLGNFRRAAMSPLDSNPKSGKAVEVIDYDRDGDLDILVGNRIVPQNYPVHVPSTLWENQNGELKDVTQKIIPEFDDFGIVNDILITDFDNDGWDDFIAVGEWSSIGFFKNEGGSLFRIDVQNGMLNEKGWWFSIAETDINNDGLSDYVLGNVGLNIKFKANKKKPFKVYSTDFDDNGTPDIVLSKKYNGAYVPVRGRECSSQQMPFIQQKFETYSEFANAKLIDIYGEKLNTAYEAEATEFKSIVLINKGDGNFFKSYLPNEAQLFPILKTKFIDVNKDGFEDAVISGNIYNTEVETPRLDAFSGLVLLSNGKDGYQSLKQKESGILLDGNIKDLAVLENKQDTLLIAAQNNGPLIVFQLKQ
ncbi:MAG: VCBS repeat-containing protein [Bacteroidota bacterium]